eukprot:TRINITY_DN206_c0_g1_i1.p1 TRINITY_DN206_c0_g1~~TRINITY_DN206_c0_g1_i1.p1  ORF type:complete len:235 (+),score=1.45 TRINITY_DN206_c0_g1_i1:99-803(+)
MGSVLKAQYVELILKELIHCNNILIINMNKVAIMRSVRAVLLGPQKLTNYLRVDMPIACTLILLFSKKNRSVLQSLRRDAYRLVVLHKSLRQNWELQRTALLVQTLSKGQTTVPPSAVPMAHLSFNTHSLIPSDTILILQYVCQLRQCGNMNKQRLWISLLNNIMVKAYDLRTKSEKELAEELAKLKAELAKARIGKVAAAATQVKATKIRVKQYAKPGVDIEEGHRQDFDHHK